MRGTGQRTGISGEFCGPGGVAAVVHFLPAALRSAFVRACPFVLRTGPGKSCYFYALSICPRPNLVRETFVKRSRSKKPAGCVLCVDPSGEMGGNAPRDGVELRVKVFNKFSIEHRG